MTESCIKPNMYTTKYNKNFYRKLSKLAVKTSIHPNALTSINIVIDVLFIVLIYLTYYTQSINGFIIVGLLPVIMLSHTFLDFFDGCVARCNNKTSKLGANLDHVADTFYYFPLYILCAYISVYSPNRWVLVPFITLIILLLTSLGIFAKRYGSLEKAFNYIGLYVEINEDSVSDCVDTTKDAPDSDFIMLMFMVFVCYFTCV